MFNSFNATHFVAVMDLPGALIHNRTNAILVYIKIFLEACHDQQ